MNKVSEFFRGVYDDIKAHPAAYVVIGGMILSTSVAKITSTIKNSDRTALETKVISIPFKPQVNGSPAETISIPATVIYTNKNGKAQYVPILGRK